MEYIRTPRDIPKFKKSIIQKSKAVTAYCFNCHTSIGFEYDISMNIETSNIIFNNTEYFIPNPRIRCPNCKKDMEITGNSVGRMNEVLTNFCPYNPNKPSYYDLKYTKGTNDGRILINHEIVQSYTYPKYEVIFKNYKEYWIFVYELISSIPLDDEFKFEGKNIVDSMLQMIDEEKYSLSFFINKNEMVDKYMLEENINEVSFEAYFSMKFSDYLNYIAYELRKLLNEKVAENNSHTSI